MEKYKMVTKITKVNIKDSKEPYEIMYINKERIGLRLIRTEGTRIVSIEPNQRIGLKVGDFVEVKMEIEED